jgi:hypothetical protein
METGEGKMTGRFVSGEMVAVAPEILRQSQTKRKSMPHSAIFSYSYVNPIHSTK